MPQIKTVKILANHTEKLLVRIRLTTKAILKPQKIYEYNCLTGGITLLLQEQIRDQLHQLRELFIAAS